MTEALERSTRDWTLITAVLDFETGNWYESLDGEWCLIPFTRVHDLLLELGFGEPVQWRTVRDQYGNERSEVIPDEERNWIIKQMIQCDRAAARRGHKGAARASERRRPNPGAAQG